MCTCIIYLCKGTVFAKLHWKALQDFELNFSCRGYFESSNMKWGILRYPIKKSKSTNILCNYMFSNIIAHCVGTQIFQLLINECLKYVMALTVLVGYLNEFLCWFLDLVKCILWQVASKGTELTL